MAQNGVRSVGPDPDVALLAGTAIDASAFPDQLSKKIRHLGLSVLRYFRHGDTNLDHFWIDQPSREKSENEYAVFVTRCCELGHNEIMRVDAIRLDSHCGVAHLKM